MSEEPIGTSETTICEICGGEIPEQAPEGMCPSCLLNSDTVIFTGPTGTLPAKSPQPSKSETEANNSETVPQFAVPIEKLRELFPDLEIYEILGVGGMGAVYRARQPRLNRIVALKILTCPPEMHTDFALRFEREAQVMALLNHPNIVTIYDSGEIDRSDDQESNGNLFYFIMEFVDGADLHQMIRTGDLKPEQALRIVPQICDALQFAHDAGVTHRDIKPANILIDKDGKVRIADFGLAKLIETKNDELGTGLTMTGTSMGTPYYMAPEQWETTALVDHRADIYSLGVVIYEMLTGSRPHGVFDPPSKSIQVDVRIDEVVMKAMESNVELRYQQASEIKDDVTGMVTPPVMNKQSNSMALLSVAGVIILALLGVIAWVTFGLKTDNLPSVAETSQLTSPDSTQSAGSLEAFGIRGDGEPIDLTRAEGITDFTQVVLQYYGWIGLRANGETVSSAGNGDRKGVKRLFPIGNGSFALLKKSGDLEFVSASTTHPKIWLSDDIPSDLKEIGLVDISGSEEQVMATLKDGSARSWGPIYEDLEKLPEWLKLKEPYPAPPEETLSQVKSAAAGSYWAGLVDPTGRLWLWGGKGLVDLGENENLQGKFETIHSARSKACEVSLSDGRVLYVNLASGDSKLTDPNMVREFTDQADGRYRPLYRDLEGVWSTLWNSGSSDLKKMLARVNGRSSETFSLTDFFRGYGGNGKITHTGLIVISTESTG